MAAMLWRHMVIKSDNDPGLLKGPLTDLFEPLLGNIYSHVTSSFLVTSELLHVF